MLLHLEGRMNEKKKRNKQFYDCAHMQKIDTFRLNADNNLLKWKKREFWVGGEFSENLNLDKKKL